MIIILQDKMDDLKEIHVWQTTQNTQESDLTFGDSPSNGIYGQGQSNATSPNFFHANSSYSYRRSPQGTPLPNLPQPNHFQAPSSFLANLSQPPSQSPTQHITMTNSTSSEENETALPRLPPAVPLPSSKVPSPSSNVAGVTLEKWAKIVQEVANSNATRDTECAKFPKLWKQIVTPYQLLWKNDKWDYFEKRSNTSDFKNIMVKWIIQQRKLKLTSDIIGEYHDQDFVTALGLPSSVHSSKVFYVSHQRFLQWATDTYKVDKAKSDINKKPISNDRIRVVSILGLQVNRDDLLKLGGAKNVTRADADGALRMEDSIYSSIQR